MKAGVIETVSQTDVAASAGSRSPNRLAADYAELVKARLTLLVLLTTAVGYYMGAGQPIDYAGLFHVVFGTASAAAGAAALNQWWERKADALMERTKTRPVPGGRMRPMEALTVGSVLSVFGVIYLGVACNGLSAFLAAITVVIYIFAYTPLKRVSNFNTLVGAVPGALPPLIGWAAARSTLDAGAWSLFAILFFWQLPHFFAIAWMYRDDYARAGFQMISNDDHGGERSASQSVFFSILLLVIAGIPAFMAMTSQVYLVIELVLGGAFIAVAMRFLRKPTPRAARLLFITSVIYLPLLLSALVLTKI
jgi:protoheme IX farnesyltransferase